MFKWYPYLASTVTLLCVACGASFSANEGGTAAVAGSSGDSNGGSEASAGSSSVGDAGQVETGGSAAGGESSTAGAGGSLAGAGGSLAGAGGSLAGQGGGGSGGRGSGGAGTIADCATLKQEYDAAVQKARVCDKGSTDQCSPSSVAQPIGGCGCPVLINAKSEYAVAAKKAYQAYQNNKCDLGGPVCDAFCAPPTAASCAQQSMGSGNSFVCTAAGIIQN
jgi:hypothetical protein